MQVVQRKTDIVKKGIAGNDCSRPTHSNDHHLLICVVHHGDPPLHTAKVYPPVAAEGSSAINGLGGEKVIEAK